MRRLIYVLSLSAMPAFAEVPKVATDIAPVHSLVAQVMQGVGTPDLIIPANASPHGYAMRPSEARNLAQADVVVWVGPTLTPWLEGPVETLATDAVHLVLADVPDTTVLPFRDSDEFASGGHDHGHGGGHDEEHSDGHDDHKEGHDDHDDHADEHHDEHEEDHGDEHADAHDHAGGMDPHLWLDPENASIWLTAIADELSKLDPDNAPIYRDNAAQGQSAIAAQSNAIAGQLEPLAGIPFVVLHDGFHYFEAYFGVEAVAAVSAGDAAKPGAARIAELRAELSGSGVRCAFAEPQIDTSLLETVTEGLQVNLGTLDPLGAGLPLGPDHYTALLAELGESVAECLGTK